MVYNKFLAIACLISVMHFTLQYEVEICALRPILSDAIRTLQKHIHLLKVVLSDIAVFRCIITH